MKTLILPFIVMASVTSADTIVANRTLPAKTIIGPHDLVVQQVDIPGAISDPALIIGQEARVALYAGRPIRQGDVGPPAVIERNQLITLHYLQNGLSISTEGRALGRAGPGDRVRVMNLASRTTVSAQVGEDGTAYVAQ